MTDDVKADVPEIRNTATGLHHVADEIQGLSGKMNSIDLSPVTWGIVGELFAALVMNSRRVARDSVGAAGDAISGVADRLNAAADKYEHRDDTNASKLGGVGR